MTHETFPCFPNPKIHLQPTSAAETSFSIQPQVLRVPVEHFSTLSLRNPPLSPPLHCCLLPLIIIHSVSSTLPQHPKNTPTALLSTAGCQSRAGAAAWRAGEGGECLLVLIRGSERLMVPGGRWESHLLTRSHTHKVTPNGGVHGRGAPLKGY